MTQPVYPLANAETAERRKQPAPGIDAFQEFSAGNDSGDRDDFAVRAADDALLAVLSKPHTYRGDSQFTTWAYKLALLEAAVKLRKRPWHGREVPLETDGLGGPAGEERVSDE